MGAVQRKSWVATILFSALLAAGCGDAPRTQPPPPAPHRGVRLRLACPKPPGADPGAKDLPGPPALDDPAAAVRAYGQAWAAREGATLEILPYDPRTGPPAEADIWVLAPAELPRHAAAGRLRPIPAACTTRDHPYAWNDLLPLYREHLLAWDRGVWGLPLLGEAPICCYRTDLLADATHRDAFRQRFGRDLEPPATWEQFAQIAEFFRDRLGDRPSLPPLPAADPGLDRAYYQVAACYARHALGDDYPAAGGDNLDDLFSFHYDLKMGLPRIDRPGFVCALEVLCRLQKCRPPEAREVPERAFQQGQAVLCVTDSPWLAVFQQTPGLRDRVGVCRVPGGERWFGFRDGQAHPVDCNRVCYLGGAGWLAVVPAGAPRPDSAFDLLIDLSGPQTSGQMAAAPRSGGGPVRDEQLRPERWDSFDLDTAGTNRLKEALQESLLHRGLKNPVLCLRTPREAAHRAALTAELRAALAGTREPAAALQEAARRWSELDREQGLEAHRIDYRLSLGLLR
jgi:multiple sugar transport system substrate-binding protein